MHHVGQSPRTTSVSINAKVRKNLLGIRELTYFYGENVTNEYALKKLEVETEEMISHVLHRTCYSNSYILTKSTFIQLKRS